MYNYFITIIIKKKKMEKRLKIFSHNNRFMDLSYIINNSMIIY